MDNKLLDENVVAQFSSQQVHTYFMMYMKNAKSLIDNIQKDLDGNDLNALRQRAHKLKGSSMVVGASSIKELAHEIEDLARENKPISQDQVGRLQSNYQSLSELLLQRYNISL